MINGSDLENRKLPPRGSEAALREIRRMKGQADEDPKPDEKEKTPPAPPEEPAEETPPDPSPQARLAALEERIQQAKLMRAPRGVEDGRSWGMGKDAAISAIEAGG